VAALSPALPAGIHALAVYDDGGGAALYAGGVFRSAGGVVTNNVARWDGASWQALGNGVAGSVDALAVFDDGGGPALFAGGRFQFAGSSARHIARWNGSSWAPLGSGMNDAVHALAVFDDGNGAALYAGGEFTTAGGVAAERVARWNGSSWAALGGGVSDTVLALAVFDDGSGPALWAGGELTSAGGNAASHVAKWDGASWSPPGTGVSGTSDDRVSALSVFDDGSGPALYAGGRFTLAGGVAVSHIARWDGASWSPLGGGVSGASSPEVRALAVFNDRTGPALHAGGTFQAALDSGDSYLAKWGCPDTASPVIQCPEPIVVDDRPGDVPGEILIFAVTALDPEDPAPDLVCTPPSGSRFPRGTTLVTCTATDFSGNAASCEFTVTVGAPPPRLSRR
jgi:hypothetical protein